ncbi:unnamed protein product [Pieris macdunnoughi]|uniref:Uncharacterized protein n=1 Tax=Pieris macdunnoughi TaxID=345717 RepID=A0A821UHT7_9NEOP|nr:unnamed protein product [Pieris macdunnoughi]
MQHWTKWREQKKTLKKEDVVVNQDDNIFLFELFNLPPMRWRFVGKRSKRRPAKDTDDLSGLEGAEGELRRQNARSRLVERLGVSAGNLSDYGALTSVDNRLVRSPGEEELDDVVLLGIPEIKDRTAVRVRRIFEIAAKSGNLKSEFVRDLKIVAKEVNELVEDLAERCLGGEEGRRLQRDNTRLRAQVSDLGQEIGALRREMVDMNARFAQSERGVQDPSTAEGTPSLTPEALRQLIEGLLDGITSWSVTELHYPDPPNMSFFSEAGLSHFAGPRKPERWKQDTSPLFNKGNRGSRGAYINSQIDNQTTDEPGRPDAPTNKWLGHTWDCTSDHLDVHVPEHPTSNSKIPNGTWSTNRSGARRDHNRCLNGLLYDRGATLYTLELDDGFYSMFEDMKLDFLQNVENLDMLVRFSIKTPAFFPIRRSSYTSGLYLHYKLPLASGQTAIANTLLSIFSFLERRFKWLFSQSPSLVNRSVYDDYIRKHLKLISKWAFPLVFSRGPAYCFLMHMDMLGSKSPWTKDMVEADITKWTSGANQDLLSPYLDQIFQQWGFDTNAANFLSFKQFCNDPLRWGTSGGAKKATIGGEVYRSKWAWAFCRMMNKDGSFKNPDQYDLYDQAIREPEVCVVALKEEEKKTREIITTPMASYLRQSYLAYRWNRLPGDSPISNPEWLGQFQSTRYSWYGCADAERFDHSVSKDMV